MKSARHGGWLAMATLVGFARAAGASELDAARGDAQKTTAALEQRKCPAFGDRNYLRGLSDPQQLTAAAEKERAYQDGAVRQLAQLARDTKVDAQMRADLSQLGSWSIAASMGNWSMLQMARQALADPSVAPGQPYPAGVIEAARERLRQMTSNAAIAPDAAATMRRQAAAVDRCTQGFNAAIFELNRPQIDAAIDAARSSADLDRVEQQYHARDA
ncbi:MAG: hypothetical protein JWQ11_2671, partial [Rhizobacter sp.]|nr:hypothetical protein [Rhizobacter sp.]